MRKTSNVVKMLRACWQKKKHKGSLGSASDIKLQEKKKTMQLYLLQKQQTNKVACISAYDVTLPFTTKKTQKLKENPAKTFVAV